MGEWVSAKPNSLLIDISRLRASFCDHSHFILETLLEISGVEYLSRARIVVNELIFKLLCSY